MVPKKANHHFTNNNSFYGKISVKYKQNKAKSWRPCIYLSKVFSWIYGVPHLVAVIKNLNSTISTYTFTTFKCYWPKCLWYLISWIHTHTHWAGMDLTETVILSKWRHHDMSTAFWVGLLFNILFWLNSRLRVKFIEKQRKGTTNCEINEVNGR